MDACILFTWTTTHQLCLQGESLSTPLSLSLFLSSSSQQGPYLLHTTNMYCNPLGCLKADKLFHAIGEDQHLWKLLFKHRWPTPRLLPDLDASLCQSPFLQGTHFNHTRLCFINNSESRITLSRGLEASLSGHVLLWAQTLHTERHSIQLRLSFHFLASGQGTTSKAQDLLLTFHIPFSHHWQPNVTT